MDSVAATYSLQDGCIVAIKIYTVTCRVAGKVKYESQNSLGFSKFLRQANAIKVRACKVNMGIRALMMAF